MARKAKNLLTAPDPIDERLEQIMDELPRNAELMHDYNVSETLSDLYEQIINNLDAHSKRADNAMDNWDMYNVITGNAQFYNGTSSIYVPIVRDAMEARKTRFTNQLFPRSGRFVDCISEDDTRPQAIMSLLDYYVRRAKIHTDVVPALIKAGDAEGQYSIYLGWSEEKRYTVRREWRQGPDPNVEIEEIKEEIVTDAGPTVEVIFDRDIMVLPTASNGVEDALSVGGSVTILRRWTKAKIKQMIEDKEIDDEAGDDLLWSFNENDQSAQRRDPAKDHLDAAGVKKDGKGKYALVYEIWCKLLLPSTLDDEDAPKEKRLCRAYMVAQDRILSVRRNPFWCDKIPVLTIPKDKIPGVCKGRPPCDAVRDFQLNANDAVNMGMDSAHYSLAPIVMTDPEKNPNYGSMILTMATVWKCSPKDTQFAQFPQLWKDAFEIVADCKQQIFQSLGVNPAQITQSAGQKKKLNQAEIAQEQQVDILTTADAVSILEQGILTPMLQWFVDLDHQFRDEDLTIPSFGEMGAKAKMERIPPVQMGKRYMFLWFGVEAAKNAQQIQQQISFLNVLQQIPPQLLQGYKLNFAPVLSVAVDNIFGPRLAPLLLQNMSDDLSTPPDQENGPLSEGIDLPVHMMDNHQQHLQSHMQMIQQTGDPSGVGRVHCMKHQMALQAQMAQQSAAQGGGGGPQPARPGGQASGPKQGSQAPAGAVHPDQMHQGMPRRAG